MRIFLIAITAVFLCCGCIYTQGTFEKTEKLSRYQSYRVPVKFYVSDIIFIKGRDGKTCFTETEATRWKTQLLHHYPEIFSPVPEKALKVKFSFYVSNYAEDVSPLAPALLLLSLPTLGFLPIINNFIMDSYLETTVEERKVKQNTTLKLHCRGNFGILGMILPTRLLLPEQKESLFETENLGARNNFTVPERNMKRFLRVFVAQLHRLKQEEIWQLYTSKYSDKVNLLE